jgi:hypothetical protein
VGHLFFIIFYQPKCIPSLKCYVILQCKIIHQGLVLILRNLNGIPIEILVNIFFFNLYFSSFINKEAQFDLNNSRLQIRFRITVNSLNKNYPLDLIIEFPKDYPDISSPRISIVLNPGLVIQPNHPHVLDFILSYFYSSIYLFIYFFYFFYYLNSLLLYVCMN